MMVRSQFVSRGFCSGERSLPCKGSPSAFRRSQIAATEPSAGFTLLELIAAMTILLLLTAVAMPMARMQVQRTREEELRRDLRDLRQAIDRYKDFSDRGMVSLKFESYGYPADLDTLVPHYPLGKLDAVRGLRRRGRKIDRIDDSRGMRTRILLRMSRGGGH